MEKDTILFKRKMYDRLLKWKRERNGESAILIQGARRIGKSTLAEEFARNEYESYILIDFAIAPVEVRELFNDISDLNYIFLRLQLIYRVQLIERKSVIIFDEIQECEEALNSLKYFCEQMPEYAIVCAGSLLGVALNRGGTSFPVGKVDFMQLYPISFQEYLNAVSPHLSQVLSSVNSVEPLPELLHAQLLDSYKVYLALGGMPEAVSRYADTHDWTQTDTILAEILKAYAFDFSKHINNKDIPRVFSVWANLQEQLARDNRKFRYGDIQKGARAREYENAIKWLCLAGLVHRVCAVSTPRLPLSAYKNSSFFKLYLSDVGLLCNKFALNPSAILTGDKLFTEFKGVLSENYVLLSLMRQLFQSSLPL